MTVGGTGSTFGGDRVTLTGQLLTGPTQVTFGGISATNAQVFASASAELQLTRNWLLLAKFNGEFACGAQVYSGNGALRYQC